MLNLRVLFPEMKQTHDMGFIKLEDGGVRAMYNRDDIRAANSRSTAGRPRPSTHARSLRGRS
jgi:hypothetical protein